MRRAPLEKDLFPDILLTDREREVLKMLAEGKPSKEIALIIDVSVKTVDATHCRTMQKLDVESFFNW